MLVGHSLGGLLVHLYASTYPGEVAGLVSIDATSEWLRELLTPAQWPFVARGFLEPVRPDAETVGLDASLDEMLRAKAAHPLRPMMPLVVLSAGLPQELPPVFGDPATLQRVTRSAQTELGRLVPYARHIISRKSGHLIELAQPRLVTNSVRSVLSAVRPVVVRCRGGASLCRARVSLAGGASGKRVIIGLTDEILRLVSVQPNRRLFLGAYVLSDQRLVPNQPRYVARLYAAQSTPNGSWLVLTFRAVIAGSAVGG